MPRWVCFCLLVLPCAAQEKTAQWIRDIEQLGGGRVLIAHVDHDSASNEIRLAQGTENPTLFTEFLQQPAFVRQFMAAQALTVSRQTPEGPQHLIFINTARAAAFKDSEEALIGHELGHAWLRAQGYPAASSVDGPASCLAIHTTDAVQHILIRKELERRGIDAQTSWIHTLDNALDQWKGNPLPATLPACERIQAASQWIDVRLGLAQAEWERKAEYEAQLAGHYPDIERVVAELTDYLSHLDVADKEVNKQALVEVARRLRALATPTTPLKTNQ